MNTNQPKRDRAPRQARADFRDVLRGSETSSVDRLQSLSVACGSLVARASVGDLGVVADLETVVDRAASDNSKGDVAAGGKHAVYEISRLVLEDVRPSGSIPKSSHPVEEQEAAFCIRFARALTSGDKIDAETRLDEFAATTIDGRTEFDQGIVHYSTYVLLAYQAARQNVGSTLD